MAPRVDSFHPRSTAVLRGEAVSRIQLALAAVLALMALPTLLGLLGGASDFVGGSMASASLESVQAASPAEAAAPGTMASDVQAPSFVQQASGINAVAVPLHAAPGGGDRLAVIAAGTRLAIGGRVRVQSGLWSKKIYWVRMDTASGVIYGFVPADSLEVVAGSPLDLDMRGIAAEHFLNPAPDAGYHGGDASSLAAQSAPEVSGVGAENRAMPGLAAPGSIDIAWLPATIHPWTDSFLAAGQKHGVDPSLLAIIALVESGGNPVARSGSGALGLMQVMPATGADIARWRGIQGFDAQQLLDPETNIDFGAWYLAQQLGSFGSADDPDWQRSVELAASAYNGGPGTVQAFLGSGRAMPNETQRYRHWVGGMWRERAAASSSTFESWLQAGGSRLVAAAEGQLASR